MPIDISACSLCDLTQRIVHKGSYWTLAINSNQSTLGRVYFLLNRHATDVGALSIEETEALWSGLRSARCALDDMFHPDHYNYMFLMNVDPHVHMHMYPRYESPRMFFNVEFVDKYFGGHYDPHSVQSLDADVETRIIEELRGRMAGQGAFEF